MSNQDTIPQLLKEFVGLKFCTKERNTLKRKVIQELEVQKAYFFETNFTTFSIRHVGSYKEFIVPKNKRGHLAKFRGKKVRAIYLFSKNRKVGFAIQDLTNF